MKTKAIVISVVLTLVSLYSNAQNGEMQTLFGKGAIAYGGFGGPRVALSKFNNQDVWLVGGRGGAIFNHTFVIGGAGYGIVNSPMFTDIEYDGQPYAKAYLEGGYGGMYFEYIYKPFKVVHLSFPLVVGGGTLLYAETPAAQSGGNMQDNIITQSTFFVLEPGIEIELNVVHFMRLTAGVSYRYANGLDLPSTPEKAFNSMAATVSLKFGKF